MLEIAGDLGLGDKPFAADRVLRMPGLNLLEGDAAMQLGVLSQVNFSQPSLRVPPKDLIPRSRALCRHRGFPQSRVAIRRAKLAMASLESSGKAAGFTREIAQRLIVLQVQRRTVLTPWLSFSCVHRRGAMHKRLGSVAELKHGYST